MLWTIAEQDSSATFFGHVVSKLAWLVSDGRPEVRHFNSGNDIDQSFYILNNFLCHCFMFFIHRSEIVL